MFSQRSAHDSRKQWTEWLKAPLEPAAAKDNGDLAQKLVRAGAEIGRTLHALEAGMEKS